MGGYYNVSTGEWSADEPWTPLPETFTGTLDGLGKTITGLYINDDTASNQGLFGTLKGTVKNLKILGSYIKANEYVGAIAGLNQGTIESCYNKATVVGTNYVGGIAGNLTKNIVKCYNTGDIVGTTNVTGGYFKSITTGEIIDVWSDKVLDEKAHFVSGEYTATAPKGFKVSTNVFEQTIEDGMVIQDSNGNEFVWVPIDNPIVTESKISEIKANNATITTDSAAVQSLVDSGTYPMALQVGTDYKGILYQFTHNEDNTLTVTVNNWNSTSSPKEPANLEGETTFSAGTTVNGTTFEVETKYKYDSQEMFTLYGLGTFTDTLYQEAFNNMIKSVADNGGFYVGRYEISNDDNLEYVETKKDKTPLVNITWYEMYKLERAYAEKNIGLGVISEMIWGAQWEQMLLFVNGKNDGATTPAPFYVAKTGNRKSGELLTKTGMNVKGDEVANIFDLEASRNEWSQESSGTEVRDYRGGSWVPYLYVAASSSGSYGPDVNSSSLSSRITLYVE